MKRRQFLQVAGAGLGSAIAAIATSELGANAQTSSVSVQYLGHTCVLLSGGGQRILVNPFKSAGCTAGYRPPKVAADLVLISSQLLDEGAVDVVPGNPRLLYESGAYNLNGLTIQGIATDHDRNGGKRFGRNVAWKWTQGGMSILHLGGAAAPISLEQKILMGTPDVVFIPVGGGPKAYTPEEARQALQVLNAKIVVPTHYRTQAAKDQCEITPLDNFLTLMSGTPVRRGGSSLSLSRSDVPKEGMAIQVMSYKF
ncbi:MBL fold metallo-hydrolase [Myxacorys almedinensis]|uniref:Zn-dependent hydrolase n=1 Tax=Myxacorys almedinensis A TaxID=2690445 RepID=A0A8J7Z1Y4_9CYAN|nr:MBL fold metallo-hydrolase [Myxacorys almedinensis]NDJ18159.1 Zn-dependent hydrolase [Myxacorys almedinensis A]